MAILAFAVSASTIPGLANVDDACRFVGGSFDSDNVQAKLAAPQEAVFDEALLACDGDGARLLSAPRELAHGGRVVIFGTPGSGKSAYARVLARRLADFAEGAPAHFVGAGDKSGVLAAFGAHIFFDDQARHVASASRVVASAQVLRIGHRAYAEGGTDELL